MSKLRSLADILLFFDVYGGELREGHSGPLVNANVALRFGLFFSDGKT